MKSKSQAISKNAHLSSAVEREESAPYKISLVEFLARKEEAPGAEVGPVVTTCGEKQQGNLDEGLKNEILNQTADNKLCMQNAVPPLLKK